MSWSEGGQKLDKGSSRYAKRKWVAKQAAAGF
jgi:hypothetical protein